MAYFQVAFEKTMINEGGYVLHEVPGDTGGMTFAGISRRWHPSWHGWELIDSGVTASIKLTAMVEDFYRANFWNKIKGGLIENQDKANHIYDFSINAGVRVAAKLTQASVGATPDGVIGPATLKLVNSIDSEVFILRYTVAKVARYNLICNGDKSQLKFLCGWLNRALKAV